MVLATYKDKVDAVRIIADTFDANPSVNIVIGENGNRRKKIKRLAEFAFIKSLNRNGAFLSNNKMGTALCFASDKKGTTFREILSEVRFAFSIPLVRVFQTLKREAYLKEHRHKEKHLYFWFLGVQHGGGNAGFELKNHLFQLSEQQQLPIILETSVLRNKAIYERYGFEVYHTWPDSGNGKTLWFMIRPVSAK